MVPDHSQRLQALDINQSFIVQAPAGSGKTGLLTQRYLALLAAVPSAPEQILAITFTRKAAAEMQERIIAALKKAQQEAMPDSSYEAKTWKLANQVLQRDRAEQWQLLQNPQRLRIQTIDSLCMYLTRRLPLLARLSQTYRITEQPQLLYEAAALELLKQLDENTEWQPALIHLLQHLDNDYQRLVNLLVGMLERREQWLPSVLSATNAEDLRAHLENNLIELIESQLAQLTAVFPQAILAEIGEVARWAGHNAANQANNPAIGQCAKLPPSLAPISEHLPYWQGIAVLLLTQDGHWRKRFSAKEGFLVPSNAPNKVSQAERKAYKQRISELLAQLSTYEDLRQQLCLVAQLPSPHYPPSQWRILKALLTLLPVAVAQLHLIFQEQQVIDHTEIALRALQALGTPEEPTDLALSLDYKFQHILIDEFQDTSSLQWALLERLTAGWQPGDGRTLFLVGDPMQSIYRFRKAEVGLFLKAQQQGIGAIQLTPLQLQVNFRSQPKVVDWINRTFTHIMPKQADIYNGAVTYSPSLALRPAITKPAVTIHPSFTSDPATEAQQIIQLVHTLLTEDPQQSIGILVQARTHLTALLPQLRAHNIPYRAVELDTLYDKPIIQDLLILTRALLRLEDRIAWLALLRAPWCQLSLADLLVIAEASTTTTVWQSLEEWETLPLSTDGQQRIATLLPPLQHALDQSCRLPITQWLQSCWYALKGDHYLQTSSEFSEIDTYFSLLTELTQKNGWLDLDQLYVYLQSTYVDAPTAADCPIEIMTIHKAKGLEFDTVILPGLGRQRRPDNKPLLLTLELPSTQVATHFLLAPIHASEQESDPIYDFLLQLERQKSHYELSRLLYVAATRAKQQLHLFGHLKEKPDTLQPPLPEKNTPLALLWPVVSTEFLNHATTLTEKLGET